MIKKITLNDIHRCIKEAIMREVGDDILVPSQGETMSQDDDTPQITPDKENDETYNTEDTPVTQNAIKKYFGDKTSFISNSKDKYKPGHVTMADDAEDIIVTVPHRTIPKALRVDLMGNKIDGEIPVLHALEFKNKIHQEVIKNRFHDATLVKNDNIKEQISIQDIYNTIISGKLNYWVIHQSNFDLQYKDGKANERGSDKFQSLATPNNLGQFMEFCFGKMQDNESSADFQNGDLKTYAFNQKEITLFSQTPEDLHLIDVDSINGNYKTSSFEYDIKISDNNNDFEINKIISFFVGNGMMGAVSKTKNKDKKGEYIETQKTRQEKLLATDGDTDFKSTYHYATVHFNEEDKKVDKVQIFTYFIGYPTLDDGTKSKVPFQYDKALVVEYDAKLLQNNITVANAEEESKFAKVIKNKIQGILRVDTLRLRLTSANKKFKIKATTSGNKPNTLKNPTRNFNFFAFPNAHLYTLSEGNVLLENFVKMVNNRNVTTSFVLMSNGSVSTAFHMPDTPEHWNMLYNSKCEDVIDLGKTATKNMVDSSQNNDDTLTDTPDLEPQENLTNEPTEIQKINENTLNLLVTETVKRILNEIEY